MGTDVVGNKIAIALSHVEYCVMSSIYEAWASRRYGADVNLTRHPLAANHVSLDYNRIIIRWIT